METTAASQLAMRTPGVWAFVLNPIVIETELPFELAPNCFINKASHEQIKLIKEKLATLVSSSSVTRPEYLYECAAIRQGENSFTYEPLKNSDWKYYVITSPDNGIININLNYVSNLSDVPLELGGLFFYQNGGMGWNPAVLHNKFTFSAMHQAKKVTRESLVDISRTYSLFMEITKGIAEESEFPEILRAITMFNSLNQLPINSEFHVLGLFSIIEMLITHNPKLEDRGDSITHQMQSKIPLLSRRFDRPLDFSTFLPCTVEKKIWAALYAYRSALAHGGLPDFNQKLQILKDAKNAKAFLIEVVKALLRHSLKEPQLYKDLRGC